MCYKIHQHHLTHDVRPIVSYCGIEKSVDLINPYAAPRPCCEQGRTIAKWFACPFGHGCCYLTSRIVKCTAAHGLERHCGVLTDYHTYEERSSPVEETKAKWLPQAIPALDGHLCLPDDCREPFLPHHEAVFDMGTEVEDLGEDLQDLVANFFTTKAIYNALENGWRCDSHEICERVLQPHECREFAVQKEMRETQSSLVEMESAISALEVKFAVRRLRFDATAFGFVGKRDISNLSLKL